MLTDTRYNKTGLVEYSLLRKLIEQEVTKYEQSYGRQNDT